jgi:ketosteroid isomerase-like protein
MKNIHLYLLTLAVSVACSSSDHEQQQNIALTQKMFEAFNKHEWQAMASYYTGNASFLDPAFGKDYVTKTQQETAAKYRELQKMFPDLHDEVVGLYPSGDKVTIEFIATGSMNDSISFKLPIVSVLTFKDGKIIRDATYYDQEQP